MNREQLTNSILRILRQCDEKALRKIYFFAQHFADKSV